MNGLNFTHKVQLMNSRLFMTTFRRNKDRYAHAWCKTTFSYLPHRFGKKNLKLLPKFSDFGVARWPLQSRFQYIVSRRLNSHYVIGAQFEIFRPTSLCYWLSNILLNRINIDLVQSKSVCTELHRELGILMLFQISVARHKSKRPEIFLTGHYHYQSKPMDVALSRGRVCM